MKKNFQKKNVAEVHIIQHRLINILFNKSRLRNYHEQGERACIQIAIALLKYYMGYMLF